jgi:hypothetical protein
MQVLANEPRKNMHSFCKEFNPLSSRGVFHQNNFKIAPIESKVKHPKLMTLLILLTVRSCS